MAIFSSFYFNNIHFGLTWNLFLAQRQRLLKETIGKRGAFWIRLKTWSKSIFQQSTRMTPVTTPAIAVMKPGLAISSDQKRGKGKLTQILNLQPTFCLVYGMFWDWWLAQLSSERCHPAADVNRGQPTAKQ